MRIGLYLSRHPSGGTSRVVSEDPKMLPLGGLHPRLDVLRRRRFAPQFDGFVAGIHLTMKLSGMRHARCL